MKFLIVFFALVACAVASPTREKRGFLSGLHSSDVYNTGYGDYSAFSAPVVSLSAPVGKVVTVDKLVDTHHVVDVPQVVNVRKVVSVPQVVSVNKVVAAPIYSSHGSGWKSGISDGWW